MADATTQLELKVLAKGWTSTIYHHPTDPSKVIKVPSVNKDSLVRDEETAQAHFGIERRAYERLAEPDRPSSILQYFGVHEHSPPGLILEYALHGDLYAYLYHTPSISPGTKRKWAIQAAESLAYVHSLGILHCDIHAANFFVDGGENLKLADFGAASIDDDRPLLTYRTSHQLWVKNASGAWHKDISGQSEIFALGCVLYGVATGKHMYTSEGRDIEEDEIKHRLRERDFPELDDELELREIIEGCWHQRYKSMEELLSYIPIEWKSELSSELGA